MSIRRRLTCSLAAAFTLLCAVGVHAQAKDKDKDKTVEALIDKAINKHYYATEFDAAESLLREANMECAGECSKRVQARVRMYLGIVLHGKKDLEGAKEAFSSARKADPSLELDKNFAGPETEKLFEEAGEKKPEPKRPAPVAPPPEPEPEPEPEPAAFAQSGQLVLGADRLFGFYMYAFSVGGYSDATGFVLPEETYSGSNLGFLGSGAATPAGGDNPGINPFAGPRVGIDYFITSGISVGGGVSYASGSYTADTSKAEGSVSALGLQLRGGYGLAFSPLFGLWPRGGLSLVTMSAKDTPPPPNLQTEVSYTLYDLTVEVPLVISPLDHFGFSVGPVIDVGLGGKMNTKTTDPATGAAADFERNITYVSYGLAAGLFGTL